MTEARPNIDRSTPHLGVANFVIGFRKPDTDMRLKQAKVEAAFRSIIDSQSTQTNVPDGFDPSAPRLVLSSGNKSIFVSQVACQLTLNFPEKGVRSIEQQWDIIAKNIREFERAVLKMKDAAELEVSSVVLGIESSSSASSGDIAMYVAERFLCRPVDGAMASAQIALGYKRDEFFVNVNVSAYERMSIEVPPGAAGIYVNVTKMPVSERGIMLQLDVNNRPRFLDGRVAEYESPQALLEMTKSWTQEQISVVFG
ncbi:hypothetical protein [Stenotrophomonas hibiscicola]|uniref:hypothetical protein n=1 Tax=Stenotrophomonas hibiscicola TaxID=86189 RepID=UPI002E7734F0|nr:hypothetical protein [[Pseudomonas] hibiscicola]